MNRGSISSYQSRMESCRDDVMKCERCNGFVMAVSFIGGDDERGAWGYDGWKCLNCGHVTDPLLMKNREIHSRSATVHQPMPRRNAQAGLRTSTAA